MRALAVYVNISRACFQMGETVDAEELVRQFRATAGSKRESVYYCEFVGWLAARAFPYNR